MIQTHVFRQTEIDSENKLVVTGGEGEGEGQIRSRGL